MKYTRAAMLLSLAATSLAHAQSAGQWVVNAGWVHLAPQDSSEPLTVNALGQSTVVPGSGATLANANTFALTTRYFVTDHVALETVLGIPPKLHLSGTGTLSSIGEMGTARAWSPAVQVQYHFGDAASRVRPYLGAGFAYVWYRDIELSRPLATGQILHSPATGSLLVGPTTASLSKTFAPVVNAGLTYNIDAHWSIGASVSYMWLSTKATLTTQAPVGTVTTTTKVRINPIASFLSVGYRF